MNQSGRALVSVARLAPSGQSVSEGGRAGGVSPGQSQALDSDQYPDTCEYLDGVERKVNKQGQYVTLHYVGLAVIIWFGHAALHSKYGSLLNRVNKTHSY